MHGLTAGDGRPQAVRPVPSHALSAAERAQLLRVANEPRFAAVPPARIVPMLADEGVYLASESSFAACCARMGRTLTAAAPRRPRAVAAADHAHRHGAAPGVVLGHDLPAGHGDGPLVPPVPDPGPVQPQDRGLGGARHATTPIMPRTWCAAPRWPRASPRMAAKPVLHGDNGSTLKATTVLAMLNWLGVKPSYSRPRVSDDNAYAESLFRTAKYRPEFPAKGFADLDAARAWAAELRALVQRRSSPQRHPLRQPGAAPRRRGSRHPGGSPRAVPPGPRSATRRAGPATRATGRPSAPSRSTPNATAVVKTHSQRQR